MKRLILFLALTAILFSSCFLPDNYDLSIDVQKNGSYTFTYKGEFNYAPAVEAELEGKYDDEDEEDLQEVIVGLKESEGFESVVNLGRGKIQIEVNVEKDAGEDYIFLDKDLKFFALEHDDKGQLNISGFELQDDSDEDVERFNTKLEGVMTVTLNKKLKVISENADKKEKVNKKTVAYIWELDYTSEKPEMVIKL